MLSDADKKYLRDMISHHEDALAMSRRYLAEPASVRRAVLSDMARKIIVAQTDEIKSMRKMLDE